MISNHLTICRSSGTCTPPLGEISIVLELDGEIIRFSMDADEFGACVTGLGARPVKDIRRFKRKAKPEVEGDEG